MSSPVDDRGIGPTRDELSHRHDRFAQNLPQNQFSVSELIQLVVHYKWYFVISITICLFGALSGTLTVPATFTARATLAIRKQKVNIADYMAQGVLNANNTTDQDALTPYLRLLKSEDFFLHLAQSLKLRENFNTLQMTPKVTTQFLNPKGWFTNLNKGLPKKFDEDFAQDSILVPIEEIAGQLKAALSFEPDQNDHIFITATAGSGYTAMTIANMAAQEFLKISNQSDSEGILQIESFVNTKLASVTEQLKSDEFEFLEFKKRNNVVSAGSEAQLVSDDLKGFEQRIVNEQLLLDENQKMLDLYQKDERVNLKNLTLTGAQDPSAERTDAESAKGRLEQLRSQKEMMISQGYKEDHWRMKALQKEIDSTAQTVTKQMTLLGRAPASLTSIERLEQIKKLHAMMLQSELKIKALKETRDQEHTKMQNVPVVEQEFLNKKRQIDLDYELYVSLRKKLNDVEIQKVAVDHKALIERLAQVPAVSPRPSLLLSFLFSALAGSFFGGIMVFTKEMLDPRVRNREDIEKCGLIFLGEVPITNDNEKMDRLGVAVVGPEMIVCRDSEDTPEAMAFNHIRANILKLHFRKSGQGKPGGQIISVTSAKAGDGKSFFAVNIATSIAKVGKKTVLVDCDFRNPKVHSFFSVQSGGLMALFHSDETLEQVTVTNVDKCLDIIPAGMGYLNPTETISSPEFSLLLLALASQYEFVILDCPPAHPMVDASVIASYSDQTILLASHRSTTLPALLGAHRRIVSLSKRRVFGVLNRVKQVEQFSFHDSYRHLLKAKKTDTFKDRTIRKMREAEKEDFSNKLYTAKDKQKNGTGTG